MGHGKRLEPSWFDRFIAPLIKVTKTTGGGMRKEKTTALMRRDSMNEIPSVPNV